MHGNLSNQMFSSSGVAQWLACWAHNPKVHGSRPCSAISLPHVCMMRSLTRSWVVLVGLRIWGSRGLLVGMCVGFLGCCRPFTSKCGCGRFKLAAHSQISVLPFDCFWWASFFPRVFPLRFWLVLVQSGSLARFLGPFLSLEDIHTPVHLFIPGLASRFGLDSF